MTEKDKRLWEDKSPIHIDWEGIAFEIIIIGAVIFMMWIGCSIASAHTHYGHIAGANKQLAIHIVRAENLAKIKARKAKEKKLEEQQIQKMFEDLLIEIFGYLPASDEITLMKRVCMAEGGNTENIDGLTAIFSVIRNRVLDPRFPNTIYEVCTQKYQFETVTTGAIWRYEVNDKVEEAWDSFLEGGYKDYPDICFFTAGGYNAYCKPAYKLGNHYFGY